MYTFYQLHVTHANVTHLPARYAHMLRIGRYALYPLTITQLRVTQ